MCLYEALLLRFVEDMDQDEISKAMEMPAGLQNLGNTCYMNATIQVILSFPTICVCIILPDFKHPSWDMVVTSS